ncbi:hypothetical protein [Sulfitobacter sp. MF3-043]|uniref:hypothetical protein n=1 Tax=Sulfitobacter sediminivivens TaxID=3252902 RepID=UPI003EBD3168
MNNPVPTGGYASQMADLRANGSRSGYGGGCFARKLAVFSIRPCTFGVGLQSGAS